MRVNNELYDEACFACCKVITRKYSTSFSHGIRAFDRKLHNPVYAIYAFVRCADEIVDTFHSHDQAAMLGSFRAEAFESINKGLSLNPVLHAFQCVVNRYSIDHHLVGSFLDSMEMDLHRTIYSPEGYRSYIYGSAEVVGLMCLYVFCEGDNRLFGHLKPHAMSLGSAFQKVNFLRDIRADYEERGRIYFPGVDFKYFNEADKHHIEQDIQQDFNTALEGIRQLPECARKGVYIAYTYYLGLFSKIRQLPAAAVTECRIRVSDRRKVWLMANALVKERML
ncbi:phytoene/squalene synthase family protein [Hufsiella ginkgonis]|uniref:Squalene/phytoene synthase family protein n=1 Tax=Hufsiella ginkgonis TaxID=2695274 RepID=A0A7K1XYL5_9SPHI|nr:phytoene/squalene synthase family protein [Hufsiella ginkgonis]MXV16043.1 squalene/phytoene synthase family protein [Hufsiella ginkgonis]